MSRIKYPVTKAAKVVGLPIEDLARVGLINSLRGDREHRPNRGEMPEERGDQMKTVTTSYSDEFVAAVVEIARIFGEEADFGAIVEKTVGDLLENIVNDPNQLIDTIEGREWDNQLEAASVAERVKKKIGKWSYTIKPSECSPGWWVVRFQTA